MTPVVAGVSVHSSKFGSKKNSAHFNRSKMLPLDNVSTKKMTGRNFIEMNKNTMYPKQHYKRNSVFENYEADKM